MHTLAHMFPPSPPRPPLILQDHVREQWQITSTEPLERMERSAKAHGSSILLYRGLRIRMGMECGITASNQVRPGRAPLCSMCCCSCVVKKLQKAE